MKKRVLTEEYLDYLDGKTSTIFDEEILLDYKQFKTMDFELKPIKVNTHDKIVEIYKDLPEFEEVLDSIKKYFK